MLGQHHQTRSLSVIDISPKQGSCSEKDPKRGLSSENGTYFSQFSRQNTNLDDTFLPKILKKKLKNFDKMMPNKGSLSKSCWILVVNNSNRGSLDERKTKKGDNRWEQFKKGGQCSQSSLSPFSVSASPFIPAQCCVALRHCTNCNPITAWLYCAQRHNKVKFILIWNVKSCIMAESNQYIGTATQC